MPIERAVLTVTVALAVVTGCEPDVHDVLCGFSDEPEVCHCDLVEVNRFCRQLENVSPATLQIDQAVASCGDGSWSPRGEEHGLYGAGGCPTAAALGRCAYDNGMGTLVYDVYYEGFSGVSGDDPETLALLRSTCPNLLDGVWEDTW